MLQHRDPADTGVCLLCCGAGIVPLECMAAARPVVAVASGGPLETVVHEETGFLCEPTPEVGRVSPRPRS